MEIMKRILLCFLLILAGCGSAATKLGPYSIGRDPTWFPLRLGAMAININGFTNALVQELSKVENRDFKVADVSWNQLFDGLENGEYAGVFSSLSPNIITTETYSFSEPFVYLGPVLVVPFGSDVNSLADMEGSTVGAYQYDDSVLIVQKYPSILIELYQSVTKALEDVASGKMAAALIPNLEARALIPNLYTDQLKIVSAPLTSKGLRLVTLKDAHPNLIKHFNKGLEKLKEDGTYQKIRHEFDVK